MNFDYTKLSTQLNEEGFKLFKMWFDEDKKTSVINKLKENDIYIEEISEDSTYLNKIAYSLIRIDLFFQKVNETTIEIYFHENQFVTQYY